MLITAVESSSRGLLDLMKVNLVDTGLSFFTVEETRIFSFTGFPKMRRIT